MKVTCNTERILFCFSRVLLFLLVLGLGRSTSALAAVDMGYRQYSRHVSGAVVDNLAGSTVNVFKRGKGKKIGH